MVHVVLFLLAPALVCGQMTITLSRPIKVTDTYLLKGFSKQVTRITTTSAKGVRDSPTEGIQQIRVDATCRVEGVTEDGQEAIKDIIIRNAEAVTMGVPSTLLPTGTRLTAAFSNQGTVFTTKNDSTLSDELTEMLSTVIRGEGGSHTGTMMNPPQAVAVGDSWQPNMDALRGVLSQSFNNTPDSLTATVQFVSVDSTASRPEAVISMTALARNILLEFDGMRPKSSSFTMTVTVHVPLDGRYPITQTLTQTRLLADFGSGPGSATIEILNESSAQFIR